MAPRPLHQRITEGAEVQRLLGDPAAKRGLDAMLSNIVGQWASTKAGDEGRDEREECFRLYRAVTLLDGEFTRIASDGARAVAEMQHNAKMAAAEERRTGLDA